MASLGETLRRGREAQGLSRAELAGRLNMGLEQLEALEDGDANRLPEPVFVIAQARRVASSLALDLTVPLQDLRNCGPFQGTAPRRETPSAPSPAAPVRSRPLGQSLGRLALAAAILAGLATGGRWFAQHWQQQQARPEAPRPPIAVATTSPKLVLRSKQPSWLEVKAAAGQVLFRGTFIGERHFPLNGGLQVLAGRPDLVQAQLGSAPSRALGPIEQVRWRRFDAQVKAQPP